MINLEHLKLYLTFYRPDEGYIDGIQLSDQVLNHLSQLKTFAFNIETDVCDITPDSSSSLNEIIQHSFSGKYYEEVVSVLKNRAWQGESVCRIHSLPYNFDYLFDLDHHFLRGRCEKIQFLTMKDEHPFDNALFRVISRDMPFLKDLTITNEHPLQNRELSLTVLVFPHLERLDLEDAHHDYAELLLLKTNTSLPRLSNLKIRNESLQRIKTSSNGDLEHFNLCNVLVRLSWPDIYY